MEFSVETITPTIARKMLDETEARGFNNRGIRKQRVEKLTHAIETGQWQVTHQAMAVTEDGIVLDGQHRLLAIIAAGQDVQVLVMRGADPNTFKVVDTGAVRTTGDSLKIAGYNNVNHLSAAVRGFMVYDKLVGSTGNYRTSQGLVTTTDVFEFLDDEERRDVAVNCLMEASRVANGLARYGLKTALCMAMMECRLRDNELGRSTVVEFFARLTDGVNLQADSPILALRRWFMHDTGYINVSNEARRPVACANTLKALNDYALGKPRSIVVFKLGNEPFPGPLARGSRKKYERELEEKEKEQAR
jgi:hypothetical protein